MAYERVSGPLGPERGDIHTAMVSVLIHNMWADKQHQRKLADFLPEWDQHKPSTPEQWLAMVRTWNVMAGGTEASDGDS